MAEAESPAPIVVIVNPVAGGRRAPAAAEALAASLRARGRAVELHPTATSGDAERLARAAAGAGARLIVAAGGDGTVQEVLRGLHGTPAALGILPCGKGNDLARELGCPRRPDEAAAWLAAGATRRIDLGQLADATGAHLFGTVAALGFDAEVSEFVRAGRTRLPGTAAYLWAVLRLLPGYRPRQVTLVGEFGVIEEEVLLVAVGNSPSYGGALRIVPAARLDDGAFDVCIIRRVSRLTILRLLGALFSGGHVKHPAVRILRTAAPFTVRAASGEELPIYADGEPLGRAPGTFTLLPGALSVVAPPPTPPPAPGGK